MKKGFTLIELLAVIVILAIVSVVAVPIMLNVIDKAKQGSSESSALGYIDAVEKQVMINKVKTDSNLLIEEGEYTKAELEAKNLNIKGEIEDALVIINSKGKVIEARFCIDGLSIDYDGKKATINEEASYCNGIPSYRKVTFDLNGGELEDSTKYVLIGSSIGTLPTPTREEYTFGGWYTDQTFTNQVDENYVITTNTTLYARWYEKLYIVKNGHFTDVLTWITAPSASWASSVTPTAPGPTDEYMVTKVTSSNTRSGYITTTTLDLTDYNRMYYDGYAIPGGSCSGASFHIGTSRDPYFSNTMVTMADQSTCFNGGSSRIWPTNTARETTYLDISTLTGSYYFSLEAMQCSNTLTLGIFTYNIWFEK